MHVYAFKKHGAYTLHIHFGNKTVCPQKVWGATVGPRARVRLMPLENMLFICSQKNLLFVIFVFRPPEKITLRFVSV